MHRIPVPSLSPDRTELWLHAPQTALALEALGEGLVEGLEVVLETPDGTARKVRLGFQHEVNCWIAWPVRD